MYQINNSKHRSHQQWAFLTRRLQRWMKNGDFARFSRKKQQNLLERLRRLYRQMLRFQTAQRLRKALGTAAVLLGLAAAPTAHAQVNFAAPQINPFGLQTGTEIRFDDLGDLDGDGDLDILNLIYEGDGYDENQFITFTENIGSSTDPQFAAPDTETIPINLPMIDGNYLNPSLADMDGDGDLDLLIGAYSYDGVGRILYYENEGTAESPSFGEPQFNPFGLNYAGSRATIPTTADLDGDGDLDVISLFYEYDDNTYEYGFGLMYIENTGTAMAPAFAPAQRQAFNLPDQQEGLFLFEFGDIDNDGDLDLLAGTTYDDNDYEYETPFLFYENIGDAQNPDFTTVVENPFGLVPGSGLFIFPLLGDMDGDGDLDVLHGNSYDDKSASNIWVYQENLLLMVDVDDQIVNEDAFKVFPTVSDGRYQMQVTGLSSSKPLNLRVFNELGQLVQQAQYDFAPAATFDLDISTLPAGVYQVELTQDKQRWLRSVVKQ